MRYHLIPLNKVLKLFSRRPGKNNTRLIFLILAIALGSCDYFSPSFKASDEGNPPTTLPSNDKFEEIHRLVHENPEGARQKAFLLLDSLSDNDKEGEIKLIKSIGSTYVLETNIAEALKYYNTALSMAEELKLYNEIASINNNIGVLYSNIGNLKSAYIHLSEALNYYELAGNQEQKTGTLNNIGLIYIHLSNFEKALTFFNDALNVYKQPNDTILIISILDNMALCYISENEPERAMKYIDRAINLSEEINNQYGLCISYQLMGDMFLIMNQVEDALDAFTKSLVIAESTNLSYQLPISKLGIAKALIRKNNIAEALEIANAVMQQAVEDNSLIFQKEAHLVLSDIYEKNNDFKNSLIHYRRNIEANQELINQTTIQQIYDVDLNNLSQLNKMQQLEIKQKELEISKKGNLLFFISLVSILLLTGMYLVYLNHRHRQKVKLQNTVIELTEKKSHAALEAEIQERKRIGQELHDSLGHLLSLAGLHASVLHKRKDCSEEKKNELLESLMKSIDDAFIEVRNISHNLAPSLLSERGLSGALKSITDTVNQGTKLRMSYKTFGLNGKMDNLIENTLFRTIQEIVNNTIKHSDASNLFIQIAQGSNEITLMAEDNGHGFDFEEIKNHSGNGLSHMKSRIENLKGSVFIDSNPHRGTIISILIPLHK